MKFSSKINFALLIPPLLLCSLSSVVLFSFDHDLARKQLIFIIVGVLLFFAVSLIDYSWILYFTKYIYIITFSLLLIVFFLGVETRGAVRWINLGFFNFQPSEFAKISLILALATYLSKKNVVKLKELLVSFMIFLPLFIPIFIQPDLGTSLVLLFILSTLLLTSRLKKTYILLAFVLIGVFSGPIWSSLKPFQKDRIATFLNPSLDPLGSGYNAIQSQIAVGSGEIVGKGLGKGTQPRLSFLPEYHTDFIFASFAEEWGLVGIFALLLLFFITIFSVIRVASNTEDRNGFLLCVGIFAIFLFQFFVNIGMNMGIMPVTGLTLPFFSYGGSSLISSFIALGLINLIWLKNKKSY